MTCSLKLSVVSILFPVVLYCVSAANAATSIFEISSSTELRSLISSYNIYNSGSPLPPNLVDNRDDFVFSIQNDIIFESYNAGTLTQVGNAVPFIRPYWPINIIIDGNGHTLSRSASAENLFRFLGVFGTVSPPPGNRTVKANVTLKNITLSGFELSGFEGGALFVGRDAEVTLKDVTFANNMVQPSASNPDEPVKGGAVYVGTRGDLKIASSTIKNNSASFGGAIASENASILILHSDISNNSAEKGGGFYISGGSFNIVDSSVSNNTATEAGGGLFADFFNTSAIRRSTFGNNAGGGLVANGVGSASNILEILTSTFSGNTNPSGGGAFEISNGQTSIENSTVTNNQGTSAINIADWSGTGFSKSISVRNSILSGNTTNSALSGFSEINCSEPNIEINGGLNLIGDDRFTQSQGLGGNCLLDTSVGANLLAFSDGGQAKRIEEILKPLADNGCCKSNSICIDMDGMINNGVGSMANLICPETHGLAQRSPAIDVFRSFTGEFAFKYAIDQRGIRSMPGPGETFNYTDLGAFEGYLPDDESCYVINTKNEKVVVFCL